MIFTKKFHLYFLFLLATGGTPGWGHVALRFHRTPVENHWLRRTT